MIHSHQVAMRKLVSICMCLVFLIGTIAYFPQISEGKKAGSILPPPDGGGNVLAGEGGGESPPFPPGFTPVKHPNPSLLNETSDGSNSWPDAGDQWVSNGTRPLSDLVPMNSSGYPNPVERGENTTLKSRIKNIGYAFLDSAELAFYDGVVSNGTLIGKRDVNLYSGEGEAEILWSVSAIGNHTVIVVADPDDDEEELNETNNMISFNLEVQDGPLPGPIDLRTTSEDVESDDLIQVNMSASVNITVSNIDSGIATDVDVRVIERPLNSTVTNYTIDILGGYSSHTQTINWTPQVNSTNYLEVILDENNSLDERNESNNVASAGFFALPWIEEWDPPGQDCENGFVRFEGDLVVPSGTTRRFYYCWILVEGDVLVYGTLILFWSVLIMRGFFPNDFEVFHGGTLNARGGVVTSMAKSVGFNFFLDYGSTISLSDLYIQWVTGDENYDSPSGIRVYTDSVTFQDVVIRESVYHGLYVNESAGGAIISGLNVVNSGYSGIFLASGSTAVVRNNMLRENLDGVYLINTALDSQLYGNDVLANKRYGILASSATTEIHNNTINWNGANTTRCDCSGIHMTSSSSSIRDNTLLHNRIGIVIRGNATNVVEGNNISENDLGLYLPEVESEGFPIVMNNTDISFNRYGVIEAETSAHFENNSFEENVVAVTTQMSTSNYTLNNFVGNLYSMDAFRHSLVSVYDNLFSCGGASHHCYGIHTIEDSSLSVQANSFLDLQIAVWERGSSSTIRGNDFYGSDQSWRVGVRIYWSTTSVLSNEFLNYNDWRGEATVIEVLQHSFPIIWNNSFESASRSIYISYSGGVIEGNSGYVRNYPWPGNDTGKRPCGGVGYYVDHSLEPLDIVGNWINYTGYSIYLVESSPRIERNHILHDFYPPGFVFNDYKDGPGVSWDEINRCAICVYHNSSPFIANNTLIGNSYGISIEGIQGKIARPIIFNNTIEKTGWMAISSSGWSPEYPANSEPNIIENTIRNSTGAGVFAADDGWANITGNIIEGTHGLTLKKPDTANETDEHYRSAISIGGWEPKFPGKDIGRGNKYVANNTISFGNHSSGIFIYWTPVTNLTVFNNTISEYPTGIYDDKRSDYHLIENNTISGIQEGIRIQSPASPVLLNNSISNTTRSESKGIVFFGKTARNSPYVLKENNSINNTRYGIFLNYTGEYITLIDIDWVHNTSYAIYTNRSIPTMKRVDIHGNPDGFGLFSIVSSPQIDEDSTFRENSNGSYFFGANGTLDPWIYDSHFDDNTRNGVILNTTSIYIEYLNASRNERGILAYGSTEGEPVYMNMKQGNLTYNTVGLYMLHGRSGQDIHGNNISGNQWGSFIKASSPDISYNDFMNNTYALVLYLDSASKVEWNTFSNSANHTEVRYGIYIEDCNYRSRQISLSNNTFSYVNQSIEIESSGKDYTGHDRNILVDYNRFRYSNYSITISSSGTSGKPIGIKNNNVTHNIEGKAIGIYSSIGEILVVSNYLWNVSVGVYIQSPSVTVERNTISVWGWGPTPIDSGPRGIYTNHGTTIIGNNTLDTTSRDVGWTEVNGIRGIWRFAFNNSVKSYEYGFRIEGGINSTIRGNHIEENGAGVRLWGAGVDPLIEENTFVDNVVGVLVQSNSSPTILNNTFESVGYLSAGIKVESGTPVIEGNTIYNIGQMGIWITGNGNPEIVQNTISYNDYGIKIQGGNATIHNNNSIHHNQWGIYMNTYNAPEVSENNTIYNNTQAGIWIGMNVGTFLKQIWWNDIVNNSVGIDVEDDPGQDNYFHCECNWWGDANGPNDPNPPPPDGDGPPDWNPNPNGQDVDDYFWYREKPPKPAPRLYWLVEPSLNSTTCYNEPS